MANEKPPLTVAKLIDMLEDMPSDAVVAAEPFGDWTADGVIGVRLENVAQDRELHTQVSLVVLELEDKLF